MKIIDILTAPWALQPEKLLELQAIYATHLRGEKIDIKAVEAALGRPLQNNDSGYTVIDGVAVIPVEGVMAKRMNLFTQISGGVSTELLGRDIKAAMNDTGVHAIILAFDSPGGSVDGTQILANQIASSAKNKPIITHASGLMASAAYWTGSAAHKIYIADDTTQVGSIGVVASHVDYSGYESARGIKTTEIVAGKYKRIASNYAPLTQEGRDTIQEAVDYFYSIFVTAVASQRNVSVERVLADMADGRVFIGRQAIDNGMVDGVATLEELIATLNQERAGAASVSVSLTQSIKHKEIIMITKEQIEKEAPEIVAAIRAAAAAAEMARIKAVEDQSIPGHEALIKTLKFDGKTTGPEAAVQILAAEKSARAAGLADLRKDTPPAIPHAPSPSDGGGNDAGGSIEDRAKAEWDRNADLRAEFTDDYKIYLAFCKAESEGKVKVLKRSA